MGLLKVKSCHTWIPSTNCLWIPVFQIVLLLRVLLKGLLEHPTYPLSPHSHISEHFRGEIGMAGFDVRSDDSCHGCFKGYRQEGSPMSCTQTPINESRGPLTNERRESDGQESCEPASLGPPTLLFVPPPFGMLLRSDHRHLKNNLMHGCSPPPLPYSTVLAFFLFFPVQDCTIHGSVGRNEEWRMERRLKVARGVREQRGWA